MAVLAPAPVGRAWAARRERRGPGPGKASAVNLSPLAAGSARASVAGNERCAAVTAAAVPARGWPEASLGLLEGGEEWSEPW